MSRRESESCPGRCRERRGEAGRALFTGVDVLLETRQRRGAGLEKVPNKTTLAVIFGLIGVALATWLGWLFWSMR